jgi:peptidoglycan hydrolase CwlO-like protein
MREKIKISSVKHAIRHDAKKFSLLVVASFFVLSGSIYSVTHADQYTDQIQQLEAQNAQKLDTVSTLQNQAGSYQQALDELQSQIASIEDQIAASHAQQAELQTEIQQAQANLALQRQYIAADIKAMYVDGQMTTFEELATSQNLSDFVDAQTYRNAVQNKIQSILAQITQLEAQLKEQNQQVSELLVTQQTQQSQLTADEDQENNLLAYNEQQQTQYDQQIQSNNSQISQLQAEEIAANQSGVKGASSAGVGCGGVASASYDGVTYSYANTYPASLCSIPQDSVVDQWHMDNRECVSYTAWMEAQRSNVANALLQEYAFGNATDWPAAANEYGGQYGITVSSTPQVGDVAIRPAIPGLSVDGEEDVGHAMYVEKVLDSNTIVVTEYNEQLNGLFSVQVRATDAPYNGYQDNLVFIHFPGN